MVTEYSDGLFELCSRIVFDREHIKISVFLEKQSLNFFDVSCLPWVRYKHFDVYVLDEGKFLVPVDRNKRTAS